MLKRLLSLLLILSVIPFASACGDKLLEGQATKYGFINPETGIEYIQCDQMRLYAVGAGDPFIMVDGDTYHQVNFEDPDEFLCIEDNGEYLLFRATTIEEPSVSEFNPIAAQIYSATNTTLVDQLCADAEYIPEDKLTEGYVGETKYCERIAEYLTNGTVADIYPTYDSIEKQYFIRLLSEDYPGLYYLVVFYGYEGRYYLEDRAEDKIVYCPNDVIERMVGKQ